MSQKFLPCLAIALASLFVSGRPSVAGVFQTRDFAPMSPWNTPIGARARFLPVPNLRGLFIGLDTWNDAGSATVPCYVATVSDHWHRLLFSPLAWTNVANGSWRRFGNNHAVEADILANSSVNFPPPGNWQSSISTSAWVLPAWLRGRPAPPPQNFRFNATMRPASGTDGDMAVGQPSGVVVETYATITLSSGDVVAQSYTVSNPKGLGTAWENGQLASMLPNYGGLVADSEIRGGITHAMAITVPAVLLTPKIAYPAAAFDRGALTSNPPYSGHIPMGGHLALPPTVNLASLRLQTIEGRAIAAAARTYGFFMDESGGGGIAIHVQPNAASRDPLLHHWNEPLQADLAKIFSYVRYVPSVP